MRTPLAPRALALAALAVAAALPAAAQPADGVDRFSRIQQLQSNSPGYHFHGLPGEATTRVYLWGAVPAPGTYIVPDETDLSGLLSLAGGPVNAPFDEAQLDRTTTVRLFRGAAGQRQLLYEAPVEEFVRDPAAAPALLEDDVVEVETRDRRFTPGWTFRETLAVVTVSVAVITAVLNVVRFTQ